MFRKYDPIIEPSPDCVTGQLVAAYTYDAYGMLVAHPINDNQFSVIGSVMLLMAFPQAYRGYVFSFVGDELCYYLGSRFYSPRLGRFLNADKHFDTGTGVLGTNMYTYCNNNPVVYTDPTGEWAEDVHSGIEVQTIKYNGVNYKYGTYYWAKECVGMNMASALIIAKACNFVDTVICPAIPLKKYQSWHFDTLSGINDSRDVNTLMCLSLAIACFEQAKSCSPNCRELIFDGLVYLGAALHPLQDKYSHTTQVSKKNFILLLS